MTDTPGYVAADAQGNIVSVTTAPTTSSTTPVSPTTGEGSAATWPPPVDEFGRPIPVDPDIPTIVVHAQPQPEPIPVPPIPPESVGTGKGSSGANNPALTPTITTVPPIPPPSPPPPAPLNDPYAPIRTTFAPTLQIFMNGKEIPFSLMAEVTNNNWYQADTFVAEFALWAQGYNYWGGQDSMLLDIRIGVNGDPPVSLIIGQVDKIETIDNEKGIVRVEGRDLTSNFIDHRTYNTFANQTSSQVVAAFAALYGMQTDIDPTTTPTGRYYQENHTDDSSGEFNRSITQWDLMCFLAQQEGYNVYVTGQTLHFKVQQDIAQQPSWIIAAQPAVAQNGSVIVPFINATSVGLDRALTLAKDVVVVVRSWNSEQRNAITITSPANASKNSQQGKNAAQRYVFVRPNLTKDQAQKLADNLRNDISKHERVIQFRDAGSCPNALKLTPRNCVQLQGTQSSWDQRYYIDSITRTLSFDGGFEMHVSAKNHTTITQTTTS